MALRHRAIARLLRHVPAVRVVTDGPVSRRLDAREAPERPAPRTPGDGLKMPTTRGVRNLRPIHLDDPSPLLIRLVRHPYAQHPVRTGRRKDTERPTLQERPSHDRQGIRELLDDVRPQFALAKVDRERITAAPKPFKRARRANEPELDTLPVEIG